MYPTLEIICTQIIFFRDQKMATVKSRILMKLT